MDPLEGFQDSTHTTSVLEMLMIYLKDSLEDGILLLTSLMMMMTLVTLASEGLEVKETSKNRKVPSKIVIPSWMISLEEEALGVASVALASKDLEVWEAWEACKALVKCKDSEEWEDLKILVEECKDFHLSSKVLFLGVLDQLQ